MIRQGKVKNNGMGIHTMELLSWSRETYSFKEDVALDAPSKKKHRISNAIKMKFEMPNGQRSVCFFNLQRNSKGNYRITYHSILGRLFYHWGISSEPSRYDRVLRRLIGRRFKALPCIPLTFFDEEDEEYIKIDKKTLRLLPMGPQDAA